MALEGGSKERTVPKAAYAFDCVLDVARANIASSTYQKNFETLGPKNEKNN